MTLDRIPMGGCVMRTGGDDCARRCASLTAVLQKRYNRRLGA